MKPDCAEIHNEGKNVYCEGICRMIGCSGMDDKYPGNEHCSIISKITSEECP